jgi:hypothetical protein
MRFKVQILDMDDIVLTEWIVVNDDDGSSVDLTREVTWLRQVNGDATNAELLASTR